MISRVHTFDEFTRLRSIVVGSPFGANHPEIDPSFQYFFQPPEDKDLRSKAIGKIPQVVVDEVEEDIDRFVRVLRDFGVEVLRPTEFDSTIEIKTPYWNSRQLYSLMPRDCLMAYGDLIIEAASPTRSRLFETFAFREILRKCEYSGAHVISAPRPMLQNDDYMIVEKNRLTEAEVLFDAANCIRIGRDIFVDVNRTANSRSVRWLERTLRAFAGPQVRVHAMSIGNDHVDVTLIPLRPGLLLVDPSRVTEATIPPSLKNWQRIAVDEVMPTRDFGLPYPLASNDGIGRNVLMIDVDTVVVDDIQLPLIRELERHGFNVIPLPYRHGRTLGGSWHCITLDLHRDGDLLDWGCDGHAQVAVSTSLRFEELFHDAGLSESCNVGQISNAHDSDLRGAAEPSADLIRELCVEDLSRTASDFEQRREELYKSLYAEHDADLLCKEIDRLHESGLLKLSEAFRRFEHLWRRDELDHTIGFIKLISVVLGIPEYSLKEDLSRRKGDFRKFEGLLEDELSICLLLAYDELVTARSYADDWATFAREYESPKLVSWMKRLAADEARHLGNLIHIIRDVHNPKRDEVSTILDKILEIDLARADYTGTFLLDHDDPCVFPEDLLRHSRHRVETMIFCKEGS